MDEDDVDLADVDLSTGEYVPGGLFVPEKPKPTPGIRFSATLIKAYQRCPASAYGKMTRQPETKGLPLVNGIAVHGGLEMFLRDERDAVQEFNRQFKFEAEKNSISITSDDAEKKRQEGEKMVASGQTLLSAPNKEGVPFNQRVDKNLIESFFSIERDGRLFVGKFDLIHFTDRDLQRYSVIDYKTNKTMPGKFELDSDIQFSMYAWAAANDPTMPTYGVFPETNTWLHLRGKNIAKDENGKTVLKVKDKKWQFSFPTIRTPESVEQDFQETIIPIAEAIENNEWRRDKGDHCSWCGFFDRTNQRCGVDLPKMT